MVGGRARATWNSALEVTGRNIADAIAEARENPASPERIKWAQQQVSAAKRRREASGLGNPQPRPRRASSEATPRAGSQLSATQLKAKARDLRRNFA
jgi:hypothetical protein